MAKIFTDAARVGASRVIEPIARGLLRLGVSPDAVTIAGTVGVVAAAIIFGARGQFVLAALVVAAFALVDTLDGTMARLRGYSTRFGAFLDSTMDRVGDGAVFGAIAFWYVTAGEHPTVAAALICLVAAQVISYVKARAQSVGLPCEVGLVERAERLLVVGVGALVTGFGVGWALPVALWLLAVLSVATVVQRIVYVWRADQASPEEGA